MEANLSSFILQLFALRAMKLGTFTLKNEVTVPLRIELSALLASPPALESLARLLAEKAARYEARLLCGASNIGLVLATLISTMQKIPLVMHRKGGVHSAQIEGVFKTGSRCLLISDLFEPRANLFDTLDALEEEGFEVRDVLVVFDWQRGGKDKLRQRGIQLHSLMTVSGAVEILSDAGKIDGARAKLLSDFFDSDS